MGKKYLRYTIDIELPYDIKPTLKQIEYSAQEVISKIMHFMNQNGVKVTYTGIVTEFEEDNLIFRP